MKKMIGLLMVMLLLALGIYTYIQMNQPVLVQPLLSPEEDEELIEELTLAEETEENIIEETEEETEDTSLTERLTIAIQETMGKIFQREVNIVAIGDSLTRGVGDRTDQGGYVGILERSLNYEEEVAHFENFGKAGNRTDQLLKRLNEEPEIGEALETADIILITIGANDIMKVARENITNLEIDVFMNERNHYEDRLTEILQMIDGFNNTADVYLLGIYNPFEQYFGDIEELNQIVTAWNVTGSILASSMENVTFIPINDLFSGNEPIFSEDNFHPNYSGYYLVAERVLDYISEIEEDEEG